jgi:hypothetical protein
MVQGFFFVPLAPNKKMHNMQQPGVLFLTLFIADNATFTPTTNSQKNNPLKKEII